MGDSANSGLVNKQEVAQGERELGRRGAKSPKACPHRRENIRNFVHLQLQNTIIPESLRHQIIEDPSKRVVFDKSVVDGFVYGDQDDVPLEPLRHLDSQGNCTAPNTKSSTTGAVR